MTQALLLLPLLLAAVTGSEQYYYDTVTPSPVVTPQPPPLASHRRPEDILLSLCPPKLKNPIKSTRKNLLIVSTLDGYITALDLNKNGEMLWSVATVPGPMLSSIELGVQYECGMAGDCRSTASPARTRSRTCSWCSARSRP